MLHPRQGSQVLQSSLDIGPPAKALRGNIHHATAGHSCWGGLGQVLHLKQHAHAAAVQLDALTVGQAQGASVIQNLQVMSLA